MGSSYKLADQFAKFIKKNPDLFREFNAPQRAAIEAALTRRMTLIQGGKEKRGILSIMVVVGLGLSPRNGFSG